MYMYLENVRLVMLVVFLILKDVWLTCTFRPRYMVDERPLPFDGFS